MPSPSVGRSLLVLGLGAIGTGSAAFPAEPTTPRYTVTSLNPGQPARLNDAGEIAGRVNVTSGTITRQNAGVYRNGAWFGLGTLEDDTVSIGTDINGSGLIVGMSNKTIDLFNSRYRAVLVENDVMRAVPGLAGMDSIAYAVNDAGQLCGAMGPEQPDSNKPWHAFVADATTVTDLHGLVEAAIGGSRVESRASGINGPGDVVGYASQSFTPSLGFVYRGGAVSILTGVDGSGGAWSLSFPAAINDSGRIAGIAFVGATSRAAVYDTGSETFTPLPVPPGMGPLLRSSAYDLDAAGSVVGEALVQLSPTSSRTFAFLYENGETLDLNTLIPAGSGWQLNSALAMNDVGQIIGSGVLDGVHGHYFLLTPVNQPPIVTIEAPPSVEEGSPVTLTAAATDPEGGALAYEWDLDGDGSYEVTGEEADVTLDPAGADGPATRTLGVRVTDEAGLRATATVTLEILNRAPTATLTASATSVYVNQPVTLALLNPFDPSPADTAAGFSYGWDCDNDGGFELVGSASSHTCVYTAGGLKAAQARIGDKDDGFSVYTVTLTVRTAEQGIDGLIDTVTGFGLSKGIETSFVKKLEAALDALAAGDLAAACDSLQAFVSHAQAQAGKALSVEQASQIIAEAEAIRAALGCL